MRKRPPKPTDAELAILHVLWDRGPSTVREVHDEVSRSEPVRYTTTLKQLQVMFDKGLVERDESARAHVYRPELSEDGTLRRLARDLVQHAFGGSAEKLVLHALQDRDVSAEELARIRRLLDELEDGAK
jgi:BlaI family penicillinase repressor